MDDGAGRILVVDDDETVRRFFSRVLVTEGYTVSLAPDGVVGMHLVRNASTRPDLILLDLDLPNADGFEVLAELRAAAETRYLPVLVVTGFDEARHTGRCFDRGANDFLHKPVDSRVLVARVRRHLGVHRESQRWRSRSCEDELTGLLTRWAFKDSVRREIGRAVRRHVPLSIAFLDLDGFKDINDGLGHSAGDRVLECVADALRHVLRRCDVAARWGGDEFVLALPGAERRTAGLVIDRIREEAGRLTRNNIDMTIGFSAGISCLFEDVRAQDDRAIAKLIEAADRSMYDDKQERTGPHPKFAAELAGAGGQTWG